MTKYQVLAIFAESASFLKPDDIWLKLRLRPDRRSVYSYLLRLRQQGLLDRGYGPGSGRLRYGLTARGRKRLEYLRQQQ